MLGWTGRDTLLDLQIDIAQFPLLVHLELLNSRRNNFVKRGVSVISIWSWQVLHSFKRFLILPSAGCCHYFSSKGATKDQVLYPNQYCAGYLQSQLLCSCWAPVSVLLSSTTHLQTLFAGSRVWNNLLCAAPTFCRKTALYGNVAVMVMTFRVI